MDKSMEQMLKDFKENGGKVTKIDRSPRLDENGNWINDHSAKDLKIDGDTLANFKNIDIPEEEDEFIGYILPKILNKNLSKLRTIVKKETKAKKNLEFYDLYFDNYGRYYKKEALVGLKLEEHLTEEEITMFKKKSEAKKKKRKLKQ